jgi:hypothetical protein
MSPEFQTYSHSVHLWLKSNAEPEARWLALYDWYTNSGRQEFRAAFKKETGKAVSVRMKAHSIVSAALPKGLGDLERKFKQQPFYNAQAAWFVEEMDWIVARVPRVVVAADASLLLPVLGFVRHLLLDSLVLFEHWGGAYAEVPGVFGAFKVMSEQVMHLFQGARQIIYGHGAWGLSFTDNHADTCIGIIRQALELRLRRGFGIIGKEAKSDGAFSPVPLSHLLEAIAVLKTAIALPVSFENLQRIYGWSNLYMHGGVKLYAWCPSRTLEYVHTFVIGSAPGYLATGKAGIQLPRATLLEIQRDVEAANDPARYEVVKWTPEDCEAVLI